jgi:two-component system, chemotaxis family, response regulator Rcp1
MPAAKPIEMVLVEDNRGDVFLVRTALREHGLEHQLRVLTDGEEALRYVDSVEAEGKAPDLVLLDLNLPKRNGDDILKRLRKGSHGRNVPVIVMTSSDSKTDRDRLAALGANAYFHKPIAFEDFVRLGDVIERVMSESQPLES